MPIPPSPARIGVRNAGSLVGKRGNVNITTQTGLVITPTDDAANDEVELAFTLPAAVGVLASHNTTQSVNNDTDTTLTFNAETYDTNTFHDTGSNPSRLTVPSGQAGTYEASYAVSFAADADGYRQVTLLKNGSAVAGYTHRAMATPTLSTVLAGSFPPLALVATDYLELRVRHTAGAALNVEADSQFGMMMVQGSVGSTAAAPDSADYWVETANGSLSAEVVVGTTGITTAAHASRQAAAKAGRLFFPNDGVYVARDSGSAWAPWGPIYPLTAPVDGDFAWVNQGGASVTAAGGGLYLSAPASASDSVRLRKKAAPATPYTITAAFLPNIVQAQFGLFGLAFRQSSDEKLALFAFMYDTGFVAIGRKYTSATAFSANYSGSVALPALTPVWLRIADDGTNRVCSWSADGQNWRQIHSVTRTDFLTADEVGFFADSINATHAAAATLVSWEQA